MAVSDESRHWSSSTLLDERQHRRVQRHAWRKRVAGEQVEDPPRALTEERFSPNGISRVDHHPIDRVEQLAHQPGSDHALEHGVPVALERGRVLREVGVDHWAPSVGRSVRWPDWVASARDVGTGSRRAAGPGGGRRRGDPRRRTGHRRGAGRSRGNGRSAPAAAARTGPLRSDYDRPETIEETAELVTALGGTGIADGGRPPRSRPGRGAGRADPRTTTATSTCWSTTSGAPRCSRADPSEWDTPIWEHDLDAGLRILRLAVDTHLITSHHLLPLLIDRPGGLVGRGHRRHHGLQRRRTTGSRCSTTWPRWR